MKRQLLSSRSRQLGGALSTNSAKASRLAKGFTMIEIIVVIAVIAIIATLTVVSYNAVITMSRQKGVEADATSMASEIAKYKAETGGYPQNLSDLPGGAQYKSTFQYSYDATARSYCLTSGTAGASTFIKSGSSKLTDGACPGHGLNGEGPITNLATNPSAEAGTTGVSGYYSAVPGRTSGGAVSGSYSFSTTTSSTTQVQGLIHVITNEAKPNQQYTCSAYLKGTAGNNVTFSGRPATSSSGYISEGLGAKSVALTSSWQRVSITFTTPANTGILMLQYRLNTPTSGVFMQSDGFICTEGSTDNQFADGSTANWIWNGTAHASSSTGPAL